MSTTNETWVQSTKIPVLEDQLAVTVAQELVKRTNRAQEDLIKLREDYEAAAEFLDKATDSVKVIWMEWLEQSATYLKEVRTWRMALDMEVKNGTKATKELIDFFGTKENRENLTALREFVELCERMEKLKQSGFVERLVAII